MKNILTNSYLFTAGLIMMLVGIYIAITTIEYVAMIEGPNTTLSINMLSDLRGMGGMLLVLGIYVFMSLFRKTWRQPALIVATAVYASFIIFRSLSITLDGLPDISILTAYLIEAVLAISGFLLINTKGINSTTGKPLIT